MQKKRDELKDLKQFGIVLAAILIVFGSIHFLKHRMVLAGWFYGIGIIVLCLGLFAPGTLKNVYAVFLKLAHALGWFNTRLILIIIYFLLIAPIAIIMKILGKDPLCRKICKKESSYWIKRQTIRSAKDQLEKQF